MRLNKYSSLFLKLAQETSNLMPQVNIIEDDPEVISSRPTMIEGPSAVTRDFFTDELEEDEYTQPLPAKNRELIKEELELNEARQYSMSFLNGLLDSAKSMSGMAEKYNLSNNLEHLILTIESSISELSNDMSIYVLNRRYEELKTAIHSIESILRLYQKSVREIVEKQLPYLIEYGDKALRIYRNRRSRDLEHISRLGKEV